MKFKKKSSNSNINQILSLLNTSVDESEENKEENSIINKGKEEEQIIMNEDDTNSKLDSIKIQKMKCS